LLVHSSLIGGRQSTNETRVFTKTGGFAGLLASGKWTSPTFSGWAGDWYQSGDLVNWFGFYNGTSMISLFGNQLDPKDIGGTSFQDYNAGGYVNSGAWIGTRKDQAYADPVAACPLITPPPL
jgi:hypothetical protein